MITLQQPLKNKNLLRTYNQPELWKTTLQEPVQPDLESSRFLYAGFYCILNTTTLGFVIRFS